MSSRAVVVTRPTSMMAASPACSGTSGTLASPAPTNASGLTLEPSLPYPHIPCCCHRPAQPRDRPPQQGNLPVALAQPRIKKPPFPSIGRFEINGGGSSDAIYFSSGFLMIAGIKLHGLICFRNITFQEKLWFLQIAR